MRSGMWAKLVIGVGLLCAVVVAVSLANPPSSGSDLGSEAKAESEPETDARTASTPAQSSGDLQRPVDPEEVRAAAVESAVRGHYEAIGEGAFETAYSYFATYGAPDDQEGWISEEESYDIASSTINSVQVQRLSENEATATVDVSFEDSTGTPWFLITWNLVNEGGDWKLASQASAERLN